MKGPAAATMTGGVLLLLSAMAHGFAGWPTVRAELTGAGAGPDVIRGMAVGWLFGSVSMAVFGIIVLWSGRSWWRGQTVSPVPACVIGAAYALFGVARARLWRPEPSLLRLHPDRRDRSRRRGFVRGLAGSLTAERATDGK